MNWATEAARQADAGAGGAPALRPLRFVVQALRSTSAAELRNTALAFACIAVVGFLLSLDFLTRAQTKGELASALVLQFTNPAGVALFGLLCWVIADRAPDALMPRTRRLVLALVACALLHAAVTPTLVHYVLGIADPCEYIEECSKHGITPSLYLRRIAGAGYVLVFGGLTLALIELRRRQCLAFDELAAEQQQRAQLTRETIESRLAAMQAQVEPQFLFDGLVDIQALYDRDALTGAAALDQLIAYLRTALPRLREAGSTLAAEAELVSAYLAVVKARHGERPQTQVDIDPGVATVRFFPMLLLPLVQRAVRGDAGPLPAHIDLTARRDQGAVEVLLRIDANRLCSDNDTLTRVRERLAGLFDGRATLDCVEQPDHTTFTLRFPNEHADRNRR